MTTPSTGKVEYPTLFVPSAVTVDSEPKSASEAKSTTEPSAMANDGPQKDAGWFTSFTGGSAPNTGDPTQPAQNAFNAQTAFSWLGQRYKPWSEFFNTKKFGLPKVDGIVQRVQYNLSYFLTNYLCIFVVLLIYCVVTSFVLLLALIALAGLFYSIRQKTLRGPVIIAGNELPPSLLYTLAIIVVIPLFYLADTSGIIGWISGTSLFLIVLHSVLYVSEEVPGSEFEVVTIS